MVSVTAQRSRKAQSSEASRVEYRALVVDDDAVVRQLTMRALTREGFRCDAACCGKDAREWLSSTRYDVVVSDLRMPVENGHTLTLHVLQMPNRPAVVNLTGFAEPRIQKFLMHHGVDHVFLKPVDYAEFSKHVRGVVERRVSARKSAARSPGDVGIVVNDDPNVASGASSESDGEENVLVSKGSVDQRCGASASGSDTVQSAAGRDAEATQREASPQDKVPLSPVMLQSTQPGANGEQQVIARTPASGDEAARREESSSAGATAAPARAVQPSRIAEGTAYRRGLYGPLHIGSRLVAVAVFLAVVIIVLQVIQALQHQRAIAAIQRLGAQVHVSENGGVYIHFQGKAAAEFLEQLRSVVGVRGLDVSASAFRDEDAASLVPLRGLQDLDLSSTEISDKGLLQLTKIESLREVNLRDTDVTEPGVDELLRRRPTLVVHRDAQPTATDAPMASQPQ